VLFTLHPGVGSPLEPLEFDGQTVTLADNTRMDLSKQLKVVIHGWGGSSLQGGQVQPSPLPESYASTYSSAGLDYTVVGVHWVPVSGWETVTETDTGDVANTLALLLYALAREGLSPSKVHVIGFSMGTIVSSKTGKRWQELGQSPLPRLTLLDPCPVPEALVISPEDGLYVEAVHTSSQDTCSTEPLAHVDFYPNGGLAQVCGTGSCSCSGGAPVCNTCYYGSPRCSGLWAWGENHGRAVELYRESIEATQGRGQTFLSWRCNYSYTQMVANSEACPWDGSSTLVSMGEDSLAGGRPQDGVYFLTTRGEEPRSYDSHLQWQQ